MSYYRVYRKKKDGSRKWLKDFDFYDDAQDYADGVISETEIIEVYDDPDEWQDGHWSRPIEV